MDEGQVWRDKGGGRDGKGRAAPKVRAALITGNKKESEDRGEKPCSGWMRSVSAVKPETCLFAV